MAIPTKNLLSRETSFPEISKKRIRKKPVERQAFFMSGRRGSNPRPSAWKANALSTELLPQICGGQGWIRTTEGVSQQIYSLPHLATLVLAQQYFKKSGRRGSNPRPSAWKANALSTELLPQFLVGKDGFEPPKA